MWCGRKYRIFVKLNAVEDHINPEITFEQF